MNLLVLAFLMTGHFTGMHAQRLLIEDALIDSTLGDSEGPGRFIEGGGWQSSGGKIIYGTGHPIDHGYFEATMRGWTAPAGGKSKAHPLAGWEIRDQYTRVDQQGSYFNWRIGTGYNPFKVLAKPVAGGTRLESHVGSNSMVNDGQPHVYRVAWQNGRVRFSLDETLLVEWTLPRFVLQYFTIGRDDWYGITDPAPVISNIRIVDLSLTPGDTLHILTETLRPGRYRQTYGDTLVGDAGAGAVWKTEGMLPPGLQLDGQSGTVFGIPEKSGLFTFTVILDDSLIPAVPDTSLISINIENTSPIFTSPGQTETLANQPFLYTAQAFDADGDPLDFSLIEAPLWITRTGTSAAGPAPAGGSETQMIWRVTDGDLSDTLNVSIMIMPETLAVVTDSLLEGDFLVPVSLRLEAAGGIPPYAWTLTGLLPRGLFFDQDSAHIHGTPVESGDFTREFQLTDSSIPPQILPFALHFRIRNIAPIAALPDTLTATEGETVLLPLEGSDPDHHRIWFSLEEGPDWLSLEDTVLTGTVPPEAADTTLLITLTDGDLETDHVIRLIIQRTASGNAMIPPEAFELAQNYPNPVNPSTVIVYRTAVSGHVCMELFNARGEKIKTLVSGFQSSGMHKVRFDSREYPAGLYYYRMTAGGCRSVKKLMVLK